MRHTWLETIAHGTETIGQGRLTDTLARIEFYHFTVFRFNPGQGTNEITMGDNCSGVYIFALDIFGKPVRPYHQNLFRLN